MNIKLFGGAALAVLMSFGLNAQTTFKNTREAVSYYENLIGELSNQVRLMQDDNAQLSGEISSLRQTVKKMEDEMANLKQETAELRKLIGEESTARNKQLGNIADKLQAGTDTRSGAAQESYDIYEVQPGATLSAVSRACGVSVEELKRANNMTKDVLYVGQKLKIPRKQR